MFRILSLDGGGIRGAYSAGVLFEIQSNIDGPIIDYFDLIVGTSTGGILALGLGLGYSPEEIVTFYKVKGGEIFPVTGVWGGFLRKIRQLIIGTKYQSSVLGSALLTIYDEKLLGDALCPVVVTSYNASLNRAHLFKSYHSPDQKMKAFHVAMATSAAPLFFTAFDLPLGEMGKNQTFLDGGIWANCPVLVGIAEAVHYFGTSISEIEVLSIGSTHKPFRIKEAQKSGGGIDWGQDLADLVMNAQQASTVGTAEVLLGKTRLTRISRETDEDIPIDNSENTGRLLDWGKEDAAVNLPLVQERFFRDPVPHLRHIESVSTSAQET